MFTNEKFRCFSVCFWLQCLIVNTAVSLILKNEHSEKKAFSHLPHSLLESPIFSYRGQKSMKRTDSRLWHFKILTQRLKTICIYFVINDITECVLHNLHYLEGDGGDVLFQKEFRGIVFFMASFSPLIFNFILGIFLLSFNDFHIYLLLIFLYLFHYAIIIVN